MYRVLTRVIGELPTVWREMKLALTHNLRLTDSEEEAEFDSVETVDAIAQALAAAGHEVERIEVSGPASHLAARLEAFGPDLIFNTAEGRRGRTREAFYPAFFEELGFPYTGSDAYVLTVTLDKWLTKLVLARARHRLAARAPHHAVRPAADQRGVRCRTSPFRSSSSPTTKARRRASATTSVARDSKQLARLLAARARSSSRWASWSRSSSPAPT